jgi:hypothetical protein
VIDVVLAEHASVHLELVLAARDTPATAAKHTHAVQPATAAPAAAPASWVVALVVAVALATAAPAMACAGVVQLALVGMQLAITNVE